MVIGLNAKAWYTFKIRELSMDWRFTAVKRPEAVFVFLLREKSFTLTWKHQQGYVKQLLRVNIFFSSLKRDSLLLKCSAPKQNCFDNGADSRHFAVFKHLELF